MLVALEVTFMTLHFSSALTQIELLATPVQQCLQNWQASTPVSEIEVAEIDPQYLGGKDLCEHYNIAPQYGANCILVEGARGDLKTLAACLVPVNTIKTNFNSVVRKFLQARTVTLAPLDAMLEFTKMEYGSITVVGLPKEFQILIDPTIMQVPHIIIGSGLKKSKLRLPTKVLLELPNSFLLPELAIVANS